MEQHAKPHRIFKRKNRCAVVGRQRHFGINRIESIMAIKVFIVDDHYMVIEGIHSLLQNEKSIEWLGHATNAASCTAFLKQQVPDVLLMDINLPDKSGIE